MPEENNEAAGADQANAENQQQQNADAGNQSEAEKVTPGQSEAGKGDEGSRAEDTGSDPFAELPEDTRTWMAKRGIKDPQGAAKLAFEQDKLLGNAIRVPGKDATDEEKEAFLNKLGRPETKDGYEFTPPKDLPENLPYDGERAKDFQGLAHKVGLTKAQAQAVHDWAVANAVNDFSSSSQAAQERNAEVAKGETGKLVKEWGPLDGQQFKANVAFADRALLDVGGQEAVDEFKRVGLIGEAGNVVLSAPIAKMLSRLGAAIYKEDDVLRGQPDRLDNPFADGKAKNVTAQMKMYRENPEQALAFIEAAGKKPEDFGIKPKAR